MPLHRLHRYRIIKQFDGDDNFEFVVQRKFTRFGIYSNFDVQRWERNDGELNVFSKQRAINKFSNLKFAEQFIPRIKKIKEDEYQAKKNKKKDIVIYKD